MTSISKIRTLVLVVLTAIVSETCDEGQFGPECRLACHCLNSGPCEEITGACLNNPGCQHGWAGPTCQIELDNVALKQPTEGAPVKRDNHPELAVDGDLKTYAWLQDSNNGTVFWEVDLGKAYNIHVINVTFYDQGGGDVSSHNRRPGFSVYIKQDKQDVGYLCHEDFSNETMPATVQTLDCVYEGQYVYIENSRSDISPSKWSNWPNLELAEVEVFADTGCSAGTYGVDCDQLCGYCMDQTCDRDTGFCSGVCKANYYGEKCDLACPSACLQCDNMGVCIGCQSTTFQGDYCNETCSQGCDGGCYQNGTCVDGCVRGMFGTTCDMNCSQCDLSDNSCMCDRDTGRCTCGCVDHHVYGDFCNISCTSIHENCTECEGGVDDGVCLSCDSPQYGGACESACPDTCTRCVNNQNCTHCKPGYSGLACQDKCKSEFCVKCNITGDCMECITGLKGIMCDDICVEPCNGCQAEGDKCTTCIDGYFLIKDQCMSCPQNCVTCSSQKQCNECKAGFYGDSCQENCSKNCHTCTNETCLECMAGWVGASCLCSDRCNDVVGGVASPVSDWCDETTGSCLHGCKDGFYLSDCSGNCSVNCSKCDQDAGKCLQCSNGRYGVFCEHECGNCADGKCNITSGECFSKCKVGHHGPFCNKTCSGQCRDGQCDKLSGHCTACAVGWYGVDCSERCSLDCNQTCDVYNGTCHGCRDGHYGPLCKETCDNCEDCDQTGLCSYCKPRLYGDFCNISCPDNCGPDPFTGHHKTECNKLSGDCMYCKPGFYMYNCSRPCSSNCYQGSLGLEVCTMSNGECIKCIPGFHGIYCDDKCSTNCASSDDHSTPDGSCDQWQGTCDKGCVRGWYGTNCTQPCNATCKQSSCNITTAACLHGCTEGYGGVYCEKKVDAAGGSVLIIVIIVVCCVILLLAVVGVLVFRRYRGKRNQDELPLRPVRKGPRKEIDRNNIIYTNLNGHSQNSQKSTKDYANGSTGVDRVETMPLMAENTYENTENPESFYSQDTKILVREFTENLQIRKSGNPNWYKDEFAKLPKGLLKPCNVAKSPENKGKCRYQMLYPYDDSRVVLEPERDAASDFINASYVNGYRNPRAFIASQGPVDVNVNDFWRMIFQQDCGKIVMLTKLTEEGKLKCVRYWPELEEKEDYGNYEVTMVSETVYPDYTLRHLEVQHIETKEAKDFKQYHFTSWPDCGVPESPGNMLSFRNRVFDADPTIPNGPILVHCSAGIGRTGTFIALDYLLRQADVEPNIDVFNTIIDMRYQRTNFIQTNVQYEFLHNAISEALDTGCMETSQEEFPQYYQSLLDVSDLTGKTALEDQFELLNRITPSVDAFPCVAGKTADNVSKNRHSNLLPVDQHRAYLSTPVKGSNEYINAVFLPTCSSKTGFLLTQMPLPQTVTDFWRLVYDQHVTHVVMMNNLHDDDDDDDVGEYWPSDDCTYGPFKIELLSCENNYDYSIMNMQLTYTSTSQTKTMVVRQFRYEGWPDNHNVPPDPKSFVNFISEVSKSYRTTTDRPDEPVISHCMNGADRSGLFCVLHCILERLQSDRRLNIPQIILHLRNRRPQLIPSLEQFHFCYSAVNEYLENLEASQIYSNVM